MKSIPTIVITTVLHNTFHFQSVSGSPGFIVLPGGGLSAAAVGAGAAVAIVGRFQTQTTFKGDKVGDEVTF